MTPTGEATKSPGQLWAGLAVVLAFAVLAGVRLGDAPVSNKREYRCFQVVDGMLASGDWVVPQREGAPWINKPPLFYWAAAVTGTLAGGHDATTLRVPSWVAGVALGAVTLAWAGSIGGAGMGALAVLLLLLMHEFRALGREGSAEMMLALLGCGALLVYDRMRFGGRSGLLPLFALLLALGILAKATAALLIIGVPLAVHLAMHRELGGALRARVLIALALALVLGFAWYAVVLNRVPWAWDRFYSEAVLPMGMETEDHTATHYGPVYEHLKNILTMAVPVTLILPIGIWRAIRTRLWRDSPRLRFQFVIFVSVLVAFSLLPKKRVAYLLPILPSVAILHADALRAYVAARSSSYRVALGALGLVAAVLGGLATGLAAFWFGTVLAQGPVATWSVAIAGGLLCLATLVFALRGRTSRFAAAAVVGWLALIVVKQDSIDIWQRQFHTGTVTSRPDYDAAHWADVRARYPTLLSSFEADDSWIERTETLWIESERRGPER